MNNLDLGKCKDGEVQGSGGLSWKSHYDKANHRGSRHSSFNYPTRGQKNSRAYILHPDTMMLRLVAQSCPTLCDPMDCSPSGSSVHGILQARILEWVVISSSRRSSQLRNRTCISCLVRQILYHCATWEAPILHLLLVSISLCSSVSLSLSLYLSVSLCHSVSLCLCLFTSRRRRIVCRG